MINSQAFQEFEEGLKTVEELLIIESRHNDPPTPSEVNTVLGLRGASSVLMVAIFEYFLRRLFEEQISELADYYWIVPLNELDEKIQVTSIFKGLNLAMKPPRYERTSNRDFDQFPKIMTVCTRIISGVLVPTAFSDTRNSAGPSTVNEMFKNMGINDIFPRIHNQFVARWGTPVAKTFIEEKLEEIVNRRHTVAHTGQALNISRNQLNEAAKFLHDLSYVLTVYLSIHINDTLLKNKDNTPILLAYFGNWCEPY